MHKRLRDNIWMGSGEQNAATQINGRAIPESVVVQTLQSYAVHFATIQNTSASDRFLKFRCRKIARGCGEKQMYKIPVFWRAFWRSDVEKVLDRRDT